MQEERGVLTTDEAAVRLGASRRRVQARIYGGPLEASKAEPYELVIFTEACRIGSILAADLEAVAGWLPDYPKGRLRKICVGK